jgi:hypothetical protein
MIHPNLVVKTIHIRLSTLCFLWHLFKCSPSPEWLCHQSITHKTKWENTFSKNGTHHIEKFKVIFFKMLQCNWKCSNIVQQIIDLPLQNIIDFIKFVCLDKPLVITSVFSLVWKFTQMWKINMKMKIFAHLFFWRKKSH